MKNEPIQENHQPSYMEIILKTSPTQRFLSFWRNRRNQITVFVGHLSMSLPLEFSNFSKHYDFSNFCKFFEKLQKLQKWQFLLGTLLPPLTLVLILARSVICPIFRNFWRNHRTCRNRSFCWAPFYLF